MYLRFQTLRSIIEEGGMSMYSLLIVEDESLVRRGLTSLIDYKQLGISDVREAENGKQAWKMIQQHQPDILLTDINMPQMDGITLAQHVKLHYPRIHIVFLTGYDYVDYLLSALKLGADDYLLKPISKKEIEAFFVTVVGKLEKERKENQIHQVEIISEETEIEKLIHSQLDNPDLSLVKVAEQLGFTPNYVSVLIKKKLGMTFQDYVITQRMNKAKVLLLSTSMKIYEVALAVGMEDVNYFSVRFKQIVGVTPKQFQKGVES